MGGKSQKQTSTSTVGPPEYIQSAYQNIVGNAQNTAAQPFQQYTGQLVAGLTPEQQAGIAGVTSAQGAWSPFYNQAAGYYGQSAEGIAPTAFSSDAVAKYMNPFQQQVIDASMAQIAENDRRQQSDLTGQAIQAGAWGGDRAGVAKAELARQQKLAGDQTLAGLNAQNYAQGLAAFQQQQGVDLASRQADAARAAAAAQGLTGLGSATQDSALKDAMAQIEAGGVQQQNTQQGLSAAYDQWLQQQAYPFESLGWLANILTGVGAGAGSTSAGMTKGSGGSSLGSILGGAMSLGSALLSDERVKEDVEQVGETNDGQPIYRFRYKGDPVMRMGLMAQDVENVHPEAVRDLGGVKGVDYEAATDDAVRDGFAGGGGVAGIPYAIDVKRRIPELNPIKGRTGLMAPPAAPNLPNQQSGSQDLSKLGTQLGGLAGKMFGGGSSFNFGGTPGGNFSFGAGGYSGMGPFFADGGAVPSDTVDMERGSDGVYRPGYAFGGDIDFFSPIPISIQNETNPPPEEEEGPAITPAWRSSRPGGNPLHVSESEAETQRLERALGMVQTPADREALVRTVYGEAANQGPIGQRAVGATIKNRAVESGLPPADVVLQKGQFEPWMTDSGRNRMLSMSPVAYSEVSRNLAPVFANEDDPTGGATHFYAPKAQAALGRNAPRWDDGSGVDIGDHRFFNIGYGGEPSTSGVAGARPVTATAYAPDENSGVKTDAFNGVSAGSGIAAPLAGGASAAAAAVDPDKGFGLGYLPKDVQMALIAAGLGMMASRGQSGGQQIGEGGLAGLQYYMAAQAARRKEAEDAKDKARKQLTEDRDFGLRSRSADVAEKSLLQRAQEAKERLGLTERQVAETERHNKAGEDKSKFSAIPGTGTDADGNQVPGTYVFDQGTGEMKFQPGMVAGARKDPEAELQRKSEFDRLKTLNADAEAARTVKGSVANLRELRKGVSYSGMPGAKFAAPIAGMAGYGGAQALESAATNFKLDLSSKLKGAISDKEQAMLQSATPGLGMSDQAANQVLDTYEGVSERAIERNKFYQAWRARNKSLIGADDAWDRYVQENPVVSAGPNGSLALNRKNLGNWQRYVGTAAKPSAPDASGGQPASSAPEAKRVSKEEYDALPAGAPYIAAGDPSNSVRYKGGKPARADGGEVGGEAEPAMTQDQFDATLQPKLIVQNGEYGLQYPGAALPNQLPQAPGTAPAVPFATPYSTRSPLGPQGIDKP